MDLPKLTTGDISVTVPLDRGNPSRGSIEVTARVATRPGGEALPYVFFLQGGPGFEAPRPTVEPANPPWLPHALEHFQVVMVDQRGTGRSTPVGLDTPLPASFTPVESGRPAPRTLAEADTQDAAEYLHHFRADEIVGDCEAVREALGASQISVLGQSFGGFTALAYLSRHPESLREVLFTGGLPPVGHDPAGIYGMTWEVMRKKSLAFYRDFPGDRQRVATLMELADDGQVLLPDGEPVSPERLRRLGHALGASGGPESLHHLLELDHRSPAFRHDLAEALPFRGRNPIYAVLHESCMADGTVTDWAAERSMPDDMREDPTLLAGEHVSRGLFEESAELRPWLGIADALAGHHWGRLYDEDALADSHVPAAAAVYFNDAYVPTTYSLETAELLPGLTPWVTSEFEHNGLRASGGAVFDRLLELARGERRR